MGKGDRTTAKGKIAIGSYGVRRPRKKTSTGPETVTTKKNTSKTKS